jgi:hypothetical protein
LAKIIQTSKFSYTLSIHMVN